VSDLTFAITGARPEPYAAVPTLLFAVRVEERTGLQVLSLALRCQIRIEPQRRRYSEGEGDRLEELFGDTPRWGETLKPFLWTHVTHIVPPFSGGADVDLPVPCTYDLDVTAAKYLHSLDGGDVPTLFLFSGTVFWKGSGGMQVSPVPWDREVAFALPVSTWRRMMDLYFPGGGWLRLRRETLDALLRCKARRALATWDDVMAALLRDAGEAAPEGTPS
jgi:hypothetical protein